MIMENEIVDAIVIVMGSVVEGFAFAYFWYRKKRHFTDYLFSIIWMLLISCVTISMVCYGFCDYKDNVNSVVVREYEMKLQEYRSEFGLCNPPYIGNVPVWTNA